MFVQVVDLGNILMEPIAKFIGHGYHVFMERNLNGGAEMTRTPHSTV
jgi:hypothetical protein